MSLLSPERLDDILSRIPSLRIAVIGDYFLDRYLVTDPALSEVSVETGLEARQVVQIRRSPGAAGTVTNNLSVLGVGRIDAIGVIGKDGEGYDLRRALEATRVRTEGLLACPDRFTPTYMKPMVREVFAERELERLDIKNRAILAGEIEARVMAQLHSSLESPEPPNAVIIADQVQERNCGVITDRVRQELAVLTRRHPHILFFADSRARIGMFRDVVIKPNRTEAARAITASWQEEPTLEEAAQIGRSLAERNGRDVYLTLGPEGILVCHPPTQRPNDPTTHVPSLPVNGPIDICGAGDSATAGIVCALCAGATPAEAAALGNLCASVTIRKLGTTGTASPTELMERLKAQCSGEA
jgi:rfaE bifunctional protein kinase chain/domain